LIEKRIEILTKKFGHTPQQLAVRQGHFEAAALLPVLSSLDLKFFDL
jgi:hypothetical protein